MKIQNILSTLGNDFTAKMVCEHCGTTAVLDSGYHDSFYHNYVIPCINCPVCDQNHYGESTELGALRKRREHVNGTVSLKDVAPYNKPPRAELREDEEGKLLKNRGPHS